jgi:alanine dehydrogenase
MAGGCQVGNGVRRRLARAFLGVQVTVLDNDPRALQRVERLSEGRVSTMCANPYHLAKAVSFADVLVGAVALLGQRAPCWSVDPWCGSWVPGL